jgi:hypothetical protein
VTELFGNLGVWTTDQTRPRDSAEVYQLRDLLKSPNHQRVQELSSNATRSSQTTVVMPGKTPPIAPDESAPLYPLGRCHSGVHENVS